MASRLVPAAQALASPVRSIHPSPAAQRHLETRISPETYNQLISPKFDVSPTFLPREAVCLPSSLGRRIFEGSLQRRRIQAVESHSDQDVMKSRYREYESIYWGPSARTTHVFLRIESRRQIWRSGSLVLQLPGVVVRNSSRSTPCNR